MTAGTLEAQTFPKYLLLFKDKAQSSYSIKHPEEFLTPRAIERRSKQGILLDESDLPVSPTYLSTLTSMGVSVSLVTKWFNGAVIEADSQQLEVIKSLPFVKAIEKDRPLNRRSATQYARISDEALEGTTVGHAHQSVLNLNEGAMHEQLSLLGIPSLTKENIDGHNQSIAVLDAGFSRVNTLGYFAHLFANKQLLDTWDFVSHTPNVYHQHVHGTQVLSTMAAYEEGKMKGTAPAASYALYRTEIGNNETPLEEVTWLCAAERADSVGVDIINSSLGYTTYDYADDNYTYEQMDGHTSIIARAARWAIRKGILVVNSVGNEGNSAWKYVVTPADVDSVLAVGAIDARLMQASFSSIGPNAEGVVKPDVVTLGVGVTIGSTAANASYTTGQGTSFAAPQMAGFAALLWQKYPHLKVMDLVNLLRKAGSQSLQPDNLLGYGLPNYERVKEIYERDYLVTAIASDEADEWIVYPNPVGAEVVIAYPQLPKIVPVRLSLMTLDGKSHVVDSYYLTDEQLHVATQSLKPGTYLLTITGATTRPVTVKFTKAH